MNGSFHNTTGLPAAEHLQEELNCRSQEDHILKMFISDPGTEYSASEIWQRYTIRYPYTPLTSIRRALSNLQERGFLIKTEKYHPGLYGKKEKKYRHQVQNLTR